MCKYRNRFPYSISVIIFRLNTDSCSQTRHRSPWEGRRGGKKEKCRSKWGLSLWSFTSTWAATGRAFPVRLSSSRTLPCVGRDESSKLADSERADLAPNGVLRVGSRADCFMVSCGTLLSERRPNTKRTSIDVRRGKLCRLSVRRRPHRVNLKLDRLVTRVRPRNLLFRKLSG